uniref:Auxin response factor n=1 Tax=Oryza punctata TaxID=4537 RepID=A0A0E0LHW7_ORYPU
MAAAPPPLADDINRITVTCGSHAPPRTPAASPPVGSVVFYFVDGHAEQFCQFPAPLLEQLAVPPAPRFFLCTVADVRLRADALTNEAYAAITLDPVGDHDIPRLAPASAVPAAAAAAGGQQQQQQQFRSFVKTLMSSDADYRNRFAAPMFVAKDVFPPLVDAKAVQPLVVKDLQGSPMTFDYGRNGSRVTLVKGWKKFQDDMDFVDGDSVIFMRRGDDELYVGVRRRCTLDKPLNTLRSRPTTPLQVAVQEVIAAAAHAAAGEQFTVTYRSRQDGDEFVVPREVVEEGLRLRARFTPEMEVEFVWAVEDGAPPSVGPQGMITAMDDTTRMWRALEIGWTGNSKMNKRANFWQVRSVRYGDRASAAPPPPPSPKRAAAAAAEGSPSSSAQAQAFNVTRDMWLACAAPKSGRLPAVGSLVYYFPDGHAEQCPSRPPEPLPGRIFLCKVTEVHLCATRNEPMATISLVPVAADDHSLQLQAPADPSSTPPQNLVSFVKPLTYTDAVKNRYRFIIPKKDAVMGVLPQLEQNDDVLLRIKDTDGMEWVFNYTWKEHTRMFRSGWIKFTNANRLVTGDNVVFMRRIDNGEIFMGLRRTLKPELGSVEEVIDAVWKAARLKPFKVTYTSRQDGDEFVVPCDIVLHGLLAKFTPGMVVNFVWAAEEGKLPIIGPQGKVIAIENYATSIWRMIQVEWASSSEMNRYVNFWQIREVPGESSSQTSTCILNTQNYSPAPDRNTVHALQLPEGTRQLQHNKKSVSSSSTEELPTFRLFGQEMTPGVPPRRDGASGQASLFSHYLLKDEDELVPTMRKRLEALLPDSTRSPAPTFHTLPSFLVSVAAPAVAKASDLYCEEPDRDDDDGLAAILHDAWELPTRPVLRNFNGATFLSKPWLALAVDGHNVVAEPQRLMPGLLLPEEMALDPASRAFLSLADGRFP